MEKWRCKLSLLVCFILCCCMLAGCTKEKVEDKTEDKVESQTDDKKEEKPSEEIHEVEDKVEEIVDKVEPRDITLHCVDDQTGEMITKTVSIKDEKDIWSALKEHGILSDDCELKDFKVDKENRKIELDFNEATGKRVRSMGTTGEYQIVGAIVNTYLDAFDCDSIKLTEDGKVFESGHAIYDGYNERYTF